jgi:hypothetical protein
VIEQRVLDQRGRLLRAALGFAGLDRPSYDRALWALRTWLDSWSGIGRIAVGMELLRRHRESAERDPRPELLSQFRVGKSGRTFVVLVNNHLVARAARERPGLSRAHQAVLVTDHAGARAPHLHVPRGGMGGPRRGAARREAVAERELEQELMTRRRDCIFTR